MRKAPLLLLLLIAAGCEEDARNDASLFLDRVEQIDLDAPLEERVRRVTSLATLPLHSTSVREARDACVSAHRAVIDAEQAHERARAGVAAHEDETRIDPAAAHDIEAEIQASNAALERSRPLFQSCQRLTRDLQLRYRSRRR